MHTQAAGLSNQLYFPHFSDLPVLDELDSNYYAETAQGKSHG